VRQGAETTPSLAGDPGDGSVGAILFLDLEKGITNETVLKSFQR
jgi:hypothetical protein